MDFRVAALDKICLRVQHSTASLLCHSLSLTPDWPTSLCACPRQRDSHLLEATEASLLESLAGLPHVALSLLLRLLMRRRTWHTVATMAFDDVPDAAAAADQLVLCGLAALDETISRASDLNMLLEGMPSTTLRGALAQLTPARHPAALGASVGSKAMLVAAVQVGHRCLGLVRAALCQCVRQV